MQQQNQVGLSNLQQQQQQQQQAQQQQQSQQQQQTSAQMSTPGQGMQPQQPTNGNQNGQLGPGNQSMSLIPQRTAGLGGGLLNLQQPPNQLPDAILATEEPADLETKPVVDSNVLANQLSTGLKQASSGSGVVVVGGGGVALAPMAGPPLPDSTSDRQFNSGTSNGGMSVPSQFSSEASTSSLVSSVSSCFHGLQTGSSLIHSSHDDFVSPHLYLLSA